MKPRFGRVLAKGLLKEPPTFREPVLCKNCAKPGRSGSHDTLRLMTIHVSQQTEARLTEEAHREGLSVDALIELLMKPDTSPTLSQLNQRNMSSGLAQRTLRNLDFIKKGTRTANVHAVTQVVNSLLALLVFPVEKEKTVP